MRSMDVRSQEGDRLALRRGRLRGGRSYSHRTEASLLMKSFQLVKPIDAAYHLELALFDSGIQDRGRRFQLRDIIDDVLPNRIVERISGARGNGLHGGGEACEPRGQIAPPGGGFP